MPIFPVYALLFADAGLSLGQISWLFVLWSVAGLVLEVPSGAWADSVSRRGLLAAASVTYGAAFVSWVLLPTFAGFALGFVLWGVSGALSSGTFQALAYDELAVLGAQRRYARVIGVGHSLAIVSLTLATLASAPLLAIGGYALAGWVSVGVCAVQLAVVLSLPPAAPRVSAVGLEEAEDPEEIPEEVPEASAVLPARPTGAWQRWQHALRTGVGEATTSRVVRGAVLASAAMLSLQVLDEYFGLLLREQGAALVLVPLLVGLISAGEAVGALVAPRATRWSGARMGLLVSAAGALVGIATVLGSPVAAAVVLTLGYGLVQLGAVVSEVRLQDSIEQGARATVISTSNVLAWVISIAAYVGVALAPGDSVVAPMLGIAGAAVLLGVGVRRWLPPAAPPPT